MRRKLIISILMMMFFFFGFIISTTNATEETTILDAFIDIEDSNGNSLSYTPPESGGNATLLNTGLDYTNTKYTLLVENNYGEEIQTDFGTFTFKEGTQYSYIYTCPVNPQDIKDRDGKFELEFTATNVDTNEVDTLRSIIIFYKIGFKENANLKVDETELIKDGKVEKDFIYLEDDSLGYVAYDESTNTLRLYNYNTNIFYSNMGSTFSIEVYGNSSYTVSSEDTDTGIKLDTTDTQLPDTAELVVDKITEGETYSTVTITLNDTVSKFYIYDISLKNGGVAFQPNGNVKISMPIPDDIDVSKLVIYRVSENGEKTEYKATVETIGNIKYATFETDHFSTYVLAEKKTEEEPENTQTEKDDTIAEGALPNAGIEISIIILFFAVVVISVITHNKYSKMRDIK